MLGRMMKSVATAPRGMPVTMLNSMVRDILAVLVLTILTSVLFGFLIIGSLYAGFYALLMLGMSVLTASLMIAGIALLVVGVLVGITISRWRQIKLMPEADAAADAGVTGRIKTVADSFLAGLAEPRART